MSCDPDPWDVFPESCLVVWSIAKDSPASESGQLRKGDILTRKSTSPLSKRNQIPIPFNP